MPASFGSRLTGAEKTVGHGSRADAPTHRRP